MNWHEWSHAQKCITCLICGIEVPPKPRLFRIGWTGMHMISEHWQGRFPEFPDNQNDIDIVKYLEILSIQLGEITT